MKNFTSLNSKNGNSALRYAKRQGTRLFMFLAVLAFATGCEQIEDIIKDKDKGKPGANKPTLKLMAEGLTAPVMLTEAPDGSGRLFVLEQPGVIRVIKDGELQEEPFLDITDKVIDLNDEYDERGLLGIAFHPQYATNGRFFLYYSVPLWPEAPDDWDHTNVVAEYRVSGDSMKADKGSERIILHQNHPYSNHNGGTLAFSPIDNYLYISIGDGGNRDDQGIGHVDDWYERNVGGNGQDIYQNFMGDILRIDVDGGSPYGIPADNPFVGKDGLDETYAFGLRNPYRFSFDMGGTHALYSQDAGQGLREEINLVTKGGNYGWNVMEGTLCFDASSPLNPYEHCPDIDVRGIPLTEPIIQFKTGEVGLVIVGGYVYRGNELPMWDGRYIFGTWSTTHEVPNGKVFIAEPILGETLHDFDEVEFANTPTGDLNSYLLGFGQDSEGEVYVLTSDTQGPHGNTGKVYKID
ncbi:PQQ-dependent sugar dehydrogenase [Pontibacter pamirensis]|uniref:PQQ-dependent sugar dehydrogenase n=1 Tax=Pontibacter pamirensis TaxID=2562824 RepID=UPI00192E7592|nr:PQQ-dependent sugar dehydrogenase [Pontibacter pamirensis]